MGNCIFCQIIQTKKAHILCEDDYALVFMDIDPITPGHVLIVTKTHRLDLDELSDEELFSVMKMSQKILIAMKKVFQLDGYSTMQNGGLYNDTGHYHLHLFPRTSEDEFQWTYGEVEDHNISEKCTILKDALEAE